MSPALERAWALYRQGRPDDAIAHVRTHLGGDLGDAEGYALLGLCHTAKKDFEHGEDAARQAVMADPESPLARHVLSLVLWHRDRDAEALIEARRAIELAPEWPSLHAFEGAILLALHRDAEAEAAARRALALDPTENQASNVLSRALSRQGRRDEAAAVLHSALAEDPDDPEVHTARGWLALERREWDAALFHFSEALRRDPNHDAARSGLVEALKAKNPLYRPLLAWFLWMAAMPPGRQAMLILGAFVLIRIGDGLTKDDPQAAAWFAIVRHLYMAFVLITWLGKPLFDLVLATNRFGRLALLPRERVTAYVVGGLAVAALASGAATLAFGIPGGIASLACLGVAIPVTSCGNSEPGWRRKVRYALTAPLALLLVAGLALAAAASEIATLFLALAAIGGFLYTWLDLALAAIPKRR
jgi:tetratricopeptide (TPR) repeat protein